MIAAWCGARSIDGSCDSLDVFLAGLVVEVLDAPLYMQGPRLGNLITRHSNMASRLRESTYLGLHLARAPWQTS